MFCFLSIELTVYMNLFSMYAIFVLISRAPSLIKVSSVFSLSISWLWGCACSFHFKFLLLIFFWLGNVSKASFHWSVIDDFVQEWRVEWLSTEGATEKLNVETALIERESQFVCDDGVVLVKAGLPCHLLLEHLREQLSRLVWFW